MTLKDAKIGQTVTVTKITGEGAKSQTVKVILKAEMGK